MAFRFRMRDLIHDRARVFRRKHKADRAPGAFASSRRDRARQCPGDFEERRTPANVVICAGTRMAKVTAQNKFLRSFVGPWDRRSDYLIFTRAHPRFDFSM